MKAESLSKELSDLVQEQLEAYNNRDLARFVRCFHPEVTVTRLSTDRVTVKNMNEFAAVYKNLFETNPLLHCELKSRIILKSSVIDEEWVTGAAKYPEGLHAVAIYAFRDNLIDRVWFPG